MAQEVGYLEDDVVFTEGPFVYVYAHGYRIECEYRPGPGQVAPKCNAVFPHASIYRLRQAEWPEWPGGKTDDKDLAEKTCDWLNSLVNADRIVLLKGRRWVCPEYMEDTERERYNV